MDTREKILPLAQACKRLERGEWHVVVGIFDPLTAVQARRLAKVTPPVFAIVLEDSDALLSAEARATLIAALRDVSLVAIAAPEVWRDMVPKSARVHVLEDAEGEKKRSADFVQFVLERQTAGRANA